MLDALAEHFPREAEWTHPRGGLFIWATMPDYIDTTDLLARALRDHVAFVPGRAAFVDGRGGSAMRLNFSGVDEDAIREGIRRIGEVVREQVAMYGTLTGAGGSASEAPRQAAAPQPDVTAAAARIASGRAAAAQRAAGTGGDDAADRGRRTDEELAKVLPLTAKHKRAG
jgi:2-aminoadipate transaminase